MTAAETWLTSPAGKILVNSVGGWWIAQNAKDVAKDRNQNAIDVANIKNQGEIDLQKLKDEQKIAASKRYSNSVSGLGIPERGLINTGLKRVGGAPVFNQYGLINQPAIPAIPGRI